MKRIVKWFFFAAIHCLLAAALCYGSYLGYVALPYYLIILTVLLIAAALIFFNWLKHRHYPPHYPLEKEGPFQPINVPDLLNRKPR